MKFRFRLEKMLHFVSLKETIKKMEVAAAIQKIQFLDNRKQQVEENIRLLLAQSGESGHPHWAHYQTVKISIDAKELNRIEKLRVDELEQLALRRDELSRISMRKKALESLREKRFEQFRVEQSRREQKQLDEVFQLNRMGKE